MNFEQIKAAVAEMEIAQGHFAKALVMEGNHNHFLLITLDISGFESEYCSDAVNAICDRCGFSPDEVMIVCSGTHNGPVATRWYGGGEPEAAFLHELVSRLPELVQCAIDAVAPASAGAYRASLPHIAHNGRFITRNFRVVNEWIGLPKNEVLSPEGPADPDLDVLVVRDRCGELLALLWSYSSEDRFEYSISQAVQDELDSRFGCHIPALYLPGCGGNVLFTFDFTKTVGFLADSIMASKAMACCDPTAIIGSSKQEVIASPRDYSCFYHRAEVELKFPEAVTIFEQELEAMQMEGRIALHTTVQVLNIGSFAIAGLPGNAFVEFALDLIKRSPFQLTCATGYCNDWLGCILPVKSFEYGGFEAWPARWARLAKGCGEFMVDELETMLTELYHG